MKTKGGWEKFVSVVPLEEKAELHLENGTSSLPSYFHQA
jgi:hypothetical protein